MDKVFTFLHTYEPASVLVTVGPFTLYWYGFFYLVAIGLGYLLLERTLGRLATQGRQWASELLANLPLFTIGLIASGLLGARLYHVATQWAYYSLRPEKILAIGEGGLAIHGALIASLLFAMWFSRRYLLPTEPPYSVKRTAYSLNLSLLDLLAPLMLLGQAIGRWGNYFNQELFGYPTTLPWGIPIHPMNRPEAFAEATHFHPVFLYESLWDFLGFIILYRLQQRSLFPKQKTVNERLETPPPPLLPLSVERTAYGLQPGALFFLYLIWMGAGRVFVELFRIEPTLMLLGFRWHFVVAGLLVLGGTIGLATIFFRRDVYSTI